MGITEGKHTVIGNQTNHCIGTTTAFVHMFYRGKNIRAGRLKFAAHLQLMGKHIE